MLKALLFYLNLKEAYSNALKLFFKQGEAEASSVIRIVILQQAHNTTSKKKKEEKMKFTLSHLLFHFREV